MFLQKLVGSRKFLEILYTNNIHYWFEKKLRNIFVFCLAFLKKIFIIILIVLMLGGSVFGAYKILIEPKTSTPESENQNNSETKNISALDIREQFAVVESENAYGSTLWIINTKPIEGYINEFLDVARNSGFIATVPY